MNCLDLPPKELVRDAVRRALDDEEVFTPIPLKLMTSCELEKRVDHITDKVWENINGRKS